MSLAIWQKNGWLRPHSTGREEIRNLFGIIERDIHDARNTDLTPDWRFTIAYNAALQCCTIPLYCMGYRSGRGQSEHYRVIMSITLTLGQEYAELRDYLNACRVKRNISDYDRAGTISASEARELIETAEEMSQEISQWLGEHYPEYS